MYCAVAEKRLAVVGHYVTSEYLEVSTDKFFCVSGVADRQEQARVERARVERARAEQSRKGRSGKGRNKKGRGGQLE